MNKRIALVITAFVVLALTLSVYYILSGSKKIDRFTEASKPKLILFHASWCPHCTSYLNPKDGSASVWTVELPKALKKESLDVELVDYEYEKNKKITEEYNVNSFPTIVFEKEGKKTKFDGNRHDVNEIVKFIKEH